MGVFVVLPLIMIGAGLSKWKVIERAAELKVAYCSRDCCFTGCGHLDESRTAYRRSITGCAYVANIIRWSCLSDWLYWSVTLTLSTAVVPHGIPSISKAGRMSLTTYITQSIVEH